MNQRILLSELIERDRDSFDIDYSADAPPSEEFQHGQTGYRVTLSHNGASIQIDYYSSTEPELEDVLSCMQLDATGYVNARDFEDWASDYGYSTDSRKAEQLWNACGEEYRKLTQLLGAQLAEYMNADNDY